MIEVSEDFVEQVARIMGGSSAAAMALTNADHRRAAGEVVTFYQVKGSFIVHGRQIGAPAHGDGKGGA